MSLVDIKVDNLGTMSHAITRSFSTRRRQSKHMSSKRRSKQSKKKSSKRRSSRRRSSVRARCMIDDTTLSQLNLVSWNVTTLPYQATFNNAQVLDKPLCSKSVSLLLPAASKGPSDTISVFYEVVINKSNICLADIFNKIYHFYNEKRVTKRDLQNLAVMDSLRPQVAGLLYNNEIYFNEFLKGATRFAGLVPQNKRNTFLVQLTA